MKCPNRCEPGSLIFAADNSAPLGSFRSLNPLRFVTLVTFLRSPPQSLLSLPLVVTLNQRPYFEPVAQLVEQRPFKAWVVRSNRTGLTTLAVAPSPDHLFRRNLSNLLWLLPVQNRPPNPPSVLLAQLPLTARKSNGMKVLAIWPCKCYCSSNNSASTIAVEGFRHPGSHGCLPPFLSRIDAPPDLWGPRDRARAEVAWANNDGAQRAARSERAA
jgi:hypothetical protein